MKRQDGRGKPIYSNEVWKILCDISKRLAKLGFRESTKPNQHNLFYKPIEYSVNGETKSGVFFADMRGNKYFPIWKHPQPSVYQQGLSQAVYWKEVIELNRSGCYPRYWAYMEQGTSVIENLLEFPTGYCKGCGKDIIDSIDYIVLVKNFFHPDGSVQNSDANIEAHYCEDCKGIEYSKKQFQQQYYPGKCEMCKVNDWDVEHHITYAPEVTMYLCRTCHGKIHGHRFPNPLWQQKKGEVI